MQCHTVRDSCHGYILTGSAIPNKLTRLKQCFIHKAVRERCNTLTL